MDESNSKSRIALSPGDKFAGYTVEKLLGKGGMGVVYLVCAAGGRQYALKLMKPDDGDAHGFRKRFKREAEFAMKIRHRNLIPVHAAGEDPATGICYIVMDYMPGGSLADRLAKKRKFSVDEAIGIVSQIADVLDVAHLNGVIHRDIKPDNILFTADGVPKLADLGVAKFDDGRTTLTTTGMIIGTPAYMAPEQMMDSRHIDGRADIYALGVVLYEMIAGRRPNADDTAVELMAKAIKGEPLPDIRTFRPEVSAAVAYILSLMCAPKPEARPTTLRDVIGLFKNMAFGKLVVPENMRTVTASPPTSAPRSVGRRHNIWLWTAASLVVFALSAGGAWVLSERLNRVETRVITEVVEHTTVVTNVVEVDSEVLGKKEEHLQPPKLRRSRRAISEQPVAKVKSSYDGNGRPTTTDAADGIIEDYSEADSSSDVSGHSKVGGVPKWDPPKGRKRRGGSSVGGNSWYGVSGVIPWRGSGSKKDKIGIAEPAVSANFSKDDALTIWDELEASFHSSEYTLISRAAMKLMMTEIGLTTCTDLLNLNYSQKAKLGQIEGIKYIIVPSLRKLGSRITLVLKTVETSTGEVDQERTAILKATSIDEIADKLEVTLRDMFSGWGNNKKCALLAPRIMMTGAPAYLFRARMKVEA